MPSRHHDAPTLGLQPDLSSCGTDILRYVLWAVHVAIPLTWLVVKGVTMYYGGHASKGTIPHSSYCPAFAEDPEGCTQDPFANVDSWSSSSGPAGS